MYIVPNATAIMSVSQVVEDVAHDAAEQAQPTADAAKQQVDAAAETVEKQVIILPFCRCFYETLHGAIMQLDAAPQRSQAADIGLKNIHNCHVVAGSICSTPVMW